MEDEGNVDSSVNSSFTCFQAQTARSHLDLDAAVEEPRKAHTKASGKTQNQNHEKRGCCTVVGQLWTHKYILSRNQHHLDKNEAERKQRCNSCRILEFLFWLLVLFVIFFLIGYQRLKQTGTLKSVTQI